MARTATKPLLLLFLLSWCCVLPSWAQRTVTGTVTDASADVPLPGVNIVIRGTSTGTITGLDGNYSIEVPGDETVLVFSFVGYEPQEIVVGNRRVLDVALDEDVALLEDVVVVGYGTQRRESVTGSVATIDADDANVGLVTSPDQLLQGRVAGVNITQSSGEPGAGFNIRIRGGTSITASNEPLYVIDGVPIDNARVSPTGEGIGGAAAATRNPLNLLNPNDIESITVLKDASATAIYGSRGANGVILITTKSGDDGRVTVDYEGYVSGSTIANKLDLLSGDDYRAFVEEFDLNIDTGPFNTDFQDEVTQTGVTQFHNLAVGGGTGGTNYRASVSYLDQQGVILSSGLQRVTGRVNASHRTLGDRLRFDVTLQSSYVEDDYVPSEETAGFEGGLFTNVFAFNPTLPIYATEDFDGDEDTDPFFELGSGRVSVRNPVALIEQVQDVGETSRTLGNLQTELEIVEGLTARVALGADRSSAARRIYFPIVSPVGSEFSGRAILRNRDRTTVTFQSYLTYDRLIGRNHSLNVLGGYEFNEYTNQDLGTEGRGFRTDAFGFNNLAAGADLLPSSSFKEESRLISFFGRANYSFADRYNLTGVLRYDGSSRFGSGNRWAVFPSLAASWSIGDEAFMRGVDLFSELRLRAGYGQVGNQEIGFYRSLATLSSENSYRAIIGGVVIPGIAPNTVPNPGLRWEETESYNVGLDYGFLNGRLNGSLEYYLKDTNDLLLEVTAVQPAPQGNVVANVGSLRNQGVEFALDGLVLDQPDLNLLFGFVFAANRQEVTDLGTRNLIPTGIISGAGQSDTRAQAVIVGEPLGTFYGPRFAGVCGASIALTDPLCTARDNPDTPANEAANRATYMDIDGDGVIEETGDDRTVIGNAQPDFTLGFRTNLNWKSFDLSAFVRGEFGRDLFNNTALIFQSKSLVLNGRNFLAGALDDPDDIAAAPFYSDRWIEDASFLRLDNVTVGYTFDLSRLTQYGRSARVYLSAQNLFVLTSYDGFDPEVNTSANLGDVTAIGIDYTSYPRPRTFTMGVSLGF